MQYPYQLSYAHMTIFFFLRIPNVFNYMSKASVKLKSFKCVRDDKIKISKFFKIKKYIMLKTKIQNLI